jgi:AraC-like DNA-binding protein
MEEALDKIVQNRLHQGRLQKSNHYFRQAQLLLSDKKDEKLRHAIYQGIGANYAQMAQTDSAFYYIRTALDIARKEDMKDKEAESLMGLATTFSQFGQFVQAEKYMRQVVPILEMENDNVKLRAALTNLALILVQQNRLEEALRYAQQSDEIIQTATTASKNTISKANQRVRDYAQAVFYANEAMRMTQENDAIQSQIHSHRNRAVIHAAQGDIIRFEAEVKAAIALRDSLTAAQNQKAIQELRIQHQIEIIELQLARQADYIRKKNLTITLLIIISLVVIASSILFFVAQRRKMKNIKRSVQQYETILKLKKEAEQPIKNTDKNGKINEMSLRLIPEIERLFKEEKIYKQPGLTIDGVAKMLNTNRNYLSTAIKDCYQKNFPDFINTFRVDDATEMFKESYKGGKYANYTIQAIGEEVGFNGKTTFYNVFKQMVGVAPSEYLKMLKKQ